MAWSFLKVAAPFLLAQPSIIRAKTLQWLALAFWWVTSWKCLLEMWNHHFPDSPLGCRRHSGPENDLGRLYKPNHSQHWADWTRFQLACLDGNWKCNLFVSCKEKHKLVTQRYHNIALWVKRGNRGNYNSALSWLATTSLWYWKYYTSVYQINKGIVWYLFWADKTMVPSMNG